MCLGMQARPGSLHPTARAPTPSARYKGLLVTGAQASGIKPEYVQFLENLPVYSAPAFSAQLGRLVVLGAALPLALPILPPLLFQRWVTSRTQQQQGQEESHTHSPVGSSSSLGPTTNSHSSNGAGASAAGAASAAPVLQQTTPVQVQSKSQAASGHASADGDIVSYPAGTPVQGLPYAPTLYFAFLHRVVWGLHDYLLAPLLGSGATPPPGAATYPGANNKTKA